MQSLQHHLSVRGHRWGKRVWTGWAGGHQYERHRSLFCVQVSKVAHFLSSIEYIEKLSVSNLSSFVHKIVGKWR